MCGATELPGWAWPAEGPGEGDRRPWEQASQLKLERLAPNSGTLPVGVWGERTLPLQGAGPVVSWQG